MAPTYALSASLPFSRVLPIELLLLLFSCSVTPYSLLPHGLWHASLPSHSPSPRDCSKSCSPSQWCHPTTSSSVLPFSSYLQSFPASGSFPVSQLFTSGGQSNWSFSFSPSNEYSGLISFSIHWFDLLAVQQTLKRLLQHSLKTSALWLTAFFMVQLSHFYMTTGKIRALTIWSFVSKAMSLLFNMLSTLVIAFLPRSNCLNFMASVTICSDFGAQENSLSLFPLFPHLLAMKW